MKQWEEGRLVGRMMDSNRILGIITLYRSGARGRCNWNMISSYIIKIQLCQHSQHTSRSGIISIKEKGELD